MQEGQLEFDATVFVLANTAVGATPTSVDLERSPKKYEAPLVAIAVADFVVVSSLASEDLHAHLVASISISNDSSRL